MNVDITTKLGVANPGTAYYMLGGLGLDVSNTTRTLKGRPLTDIGTTVTLQNAGNGINFGTEEVLRICITKNIIHIFRMVSILEAVVLLAG
jgi:hypothetical protein